MSELLSCIEINPKKPAVGAVIWLHGLGADGHDFVPIVSELNLNDTLPLRFVFPHAPMMPVTINNGYVMRAWYDIVSMTIDQHADQSGIENSVKQVHALLQREEQKGFAVDKIVLAGFSQGALIALTTALCMTKKLAGVLALSGYLPETEKKIRAANGANQHTPIFLGHGVEDGIVPQQLGERMYHVLKEHQYNVDWHSYNMAHSVNAKEIQDIGVWLKKIFV